MIEFIKMLNRIGSAEEIQQLKNFIKDAEMQKKVIDFVNENKIDCNHLWENTSDGDKATEDWNNLFTYIIKLKK
jgi:hypothetical protein